MNNKEPQMNAKKEVARIIVNSAAEFLAAKHGTTVEQVWEALASGHATLTKNFTELVVLGGKEANALVAQA
jgi:hypothetical protein